MPGLTRRPDRLARRVLVLAVAAALVLGPVCGAAWWLLAPDVLVQVGEAGASLRSVQAQRLFAVDAVFVLVTAGAGLLTGTVLAPRSLVRPGALLTGLVVGGLAGSVLAWQVGMLLGPGPVEPRVAAAGVGDMVPLPLGLEAYGALLAWPIAAVATVLVVVAIMPPDPAPPDPAATGAGSSAPVSPGERSRPWTPG